MGSSPKPKPSARVVRVGRNSVLLDDVRAVGEGAGASPSKPPRLIFELIDIDPAVLQHVRVGSKATLRNQREVHISVGRLGDLPLEATTEAKRVHPASGVIEHVGLSPPSVLVGFTCRDADP